MTNETVACPFCEADISASAKKCRHCSEWVARSCQICGTPIRGEWAARGLCAECQRNRVLPFGAPGALVRGTRSRPIAAILSLTLGGVGVHKFYLGQTGKGFLYLFFFWTMIPALIALFEGFNFAIMSDEEFHRRFPG
ncbi:MAG: NINE protein [Gemmatimonadota bacterium]|nr:NINE protein [Gemmatimonadota bacterium]